MTIFYLQNETYGRLGNNNCYFLYKHEDLSSILGIYGGKKDGHAGRLVISALGRKGQADS